MSDSPSGMTVLFRILRPKRATLILAIVLTVMAAFFELLPFWLLYLSVELVLSGGQEIYLGLYNLAIWMVVVLMTKYTIYLMAYYLSHRAAFDILMQLRKDLVQRLVWAPLLWLQKYSSGELKKIIMQDVERLEQFIAHHTVELVAAFCTPIFVAVFLFYVDWRLALVALSVVPLALLAQSFFMRGLGKSIEEYERAVADLNSASLEYVRNLPVMKTFRQDGKSFRHMRARVQTYRSLITKITYRTVPGWSVFSVLISANLFFILPVGLWLMEQKKLELPELVLALMLSAGMLRPWLRVMRFSSEIREIVKSVERIAPFMNWTAPSSLSQVEMLSAPDIDFRSVGFSYGDKPFVEALNMHVPAGRMTALVGPSGSGKSTICYLLSGLMQPQKGSIHIGGIALTDIGEQQLSNIMSVVTQEAFMFRGTLLDNIRLGRPDAGEEDVLKAARVAQADEFIRILPQAYHTPVGERGHSLSGGERQRIAIARALLMNTPILVLDEATAFADALTEKRFYQAMKEDYPDRTLLVVTHRLHSIEQADQIIVLERGACVDTGAHEELLARCALYQRLWDYQISCENWSIADREMANVMVS